METHEAFALLDEIDRIMADRVLASVVPDVFTILDDANAGRHEIEPIEAKLSPELRLRLQAMANSVYMGTLRRGKVESFYDAVNCLGMHRTMAFLIALASSRIVPLDPAVAVVIARSYATSVMAHVLAL